MLCSGPPGCAGCILGSAAPSPIPVWLLLEECGADTGLQASYWLLASGSVCVSPPDGWGLTFVHSRSWGAPRVESTEGGDPPPSHQLSRMSPRRVSPPPLWGSLPQRHTPRGGIREPGIPFPSAAPPGGLTPSFLPHEALETKAISNTFISQHEIKLTGGKGKGGGGRGTLF